MWLPSFSYTMNGISGPSSAIELIPWSRAKKTRSANFSLMCDGGFKSVATALNPSGASRGGQHFDFFDEPVSKPFLLLFEIKVGLQVEPKLRRHAEIAAKAQGGVRRNRTLAFDNLIDPARRHADVLGQPVLRNCHRLEEFLVEDFTRRDVRQQFAFHN